MLRAGCIKNLFWRNGSFLKPNRIPEPVRFQAVFENYIPVWESEFAGWIVLKGKFNYCWYDGHYYFLTPIEIQDTEEAIIKYSIVRDFWVDALLQGIQLKGSLVRTNNTFVLLNNLNKTTPIISEPLIRSTISLEKVKPGESFRKLQIHLPESPPWNILTRYTLKHEDWNGFVKRIKEFLSTHNRDSEYVTIIGRLNKSEEEDWRSHIWEYLNIVASDVGNLRIGKITNLQGSKLKDSYIIFDKNDVETFKGILTVQDEETVFLKNDRLDLTGLIDVVEVDLSDTKSRIEGINATRWYGNKSKTNDSERLSWTITRNPTLPIGSKEDADYSGEEFDTVASLYENNYIGKPSQKVELIDGTILRPWYIDNLDFTLMGYKNNETNKIVLDDQWYYNEYYPFRNSGYNTAGDYLDDCHFPIGFTLLEPNTYNLTADFQRIGSNTWKHKLDLRYPEDDVLEVVEYNVGISQSWKYDEELNKLKTRSVFNKFLENNETIDKLNPIWHLYMNLYEVYPFLLHWIPINLRNYAYWWKSPLKKWYSLEHDYPYKYINRGTHIYGSKNDVNNKFNDSIARLKFEVLLSEPMLLDNITPTKNDIVWNDSHFCLYDSTGHIPVLYNPTDFLSDKKRTIISSDELNDRDILAIWDPYQKEVKIRILQKESHEVKLAPDNLVRNVDGKTYNIVTWFCLKSSGILEETKTAWIKKVQEEEWRREIIKRLDDIIINDNDAIDNIDFYNYFGNYEEIYDVLKLDKNKPRLKNILRRLPKKNDGNYDYEKIYDILTSLGYITTSSWTTPFIYLTKSVVVGSVGYAAGAWAAQQRFNDARYYPNEIARKNESLKIHKKLVEKLIIQEHTRSSKKLLRAQQWFERKYFEKFENKRILDAKYWKPYYKVRDFWAARENPKWHRMPFSYTGKWNKPFIKNLGPFFSKTTFGRVTFARYAKNVAVRKFAGSVAGSLAFAIQTAYDVSIQGIHDYQNARCFLYDKDDNVIVLWNTWYYQSKIPFFNLVAKLFQAETLDDYDSEATKNLVKRIFYQTYWGTDGEKIYNPSKEELEAKDIRLFSLEGTNYWLLLLKGKTYFIPKNVDDLEIGSISEYSLPIDTVLGGDLIDKLNERNDLQVLNKTYELKTKITDASDIVVKFSPIISPTVMKKSPDDLYLVDVITPLDTIYETLEVPKNIYADSSEFNVIDYKRNLLQKEHLDQEFREKRKQLELKGDEVALKDYEDVVQNTILYSSSVIRSILGVASGSLGYMKAGISASVLMMNASRNITAGIVGSIARNQRDRFLQKSERQHIAEHLFESFRLDAEHKRERIKHKLEIEKQTSVYDHVLLTSKDIVNALNKFQSLNDIYIVRWLPNKVQRELALFHLDNYGVECNISDYDLFISTDMDEGIYEFINIDYIDVGNEFFYKFLETLFTNGVRIINVSLDYVVTTEGEEPQESLWNKQILLLENKLSTISEDHAKEVEKIAEQTKEELEKLKVELNTVKDELDAEKIKLVTTKEELEKEKAKLVTADAELRAAAEDAEQYKEKLKKSEEELEAATRKIGELEANKADPKEIEKLQEEINVLNNRIEQDRGKIAELEKKETVVMGYTKEQVIDKVMRYLFVFYNYLEDGVDGTEYATYKASEQGPGKPPNYPYYKFWKVVGKRIKDGGNPYFVDTQAFVRNTQLVKELAWNVWNFLPRLKTAEPEEYTMLLEKKPSDFFASAEESAYWTLRQRDLVNAWTEFKKQFKRTDQFTLSFPEPPNYNTLLTQCQTQLQEAIKNKEELDEQLVIANRKIAEYEKKEADRRRKRELKAKKN